MHPYTHTHTCTFAHKCTNKQTNKQANEPRDPYIEIYIETTRKKKNVYNLTATRLTRGRRFLLNKFHDDNKQKNGGSRQAVTRALGDESCAACRSRGITATHTAHTGVTAYGKRLAHAPCAAMLNSKICTSYKVSLFIIRVDSISI